ncbi:MAG: DUF192 domain-containing protein [Bacteroidota bacterium]
MTRAFTLALCLATLSACQPGDSGETPSPEPTESIPFQIDGELTFLRDGTPITTIAIEVADTDSTRTRGMMERTVIPDATGMLFIFDRAEMQGFWMDNTPSALDIMFFDADSTLLNVEANAVPYQQTPTYNSDGPAQFVVETPAGFARRYGLTPGVRIDWTLADMQVPADSSRANP